ncbi:hypothetical protein Smic_26000 [Streptomyces microflavus]|uniref:Uncharacterized protein n=1 Tax=Streptomyces microflavus TaxID=1919 RepID=A0A7J0CQ64_STRMI|nr:hypothetical protein Smic_26000 [Streptomyces microflavus]
MGGAGGPGEWAGGVGMEGSSIRGGESGGNVHFNAAFRPPTVFLAPAPPALHLLRETEGSPWLSTTP